MTKGLKQNRRSTPAIIAIVLGLLMPAAAAFAQAHSNPNPRVLPPGSTPFGHTYGEWSARWWQWALSIPSATNPVADTTGANCAAGQFGPVWFLAGTFGGAAVRNCTVPAGRALFFPIIDQEIDNFVCVIPDTSLDIDGLRALAKSIIDLAENMSAEVDGVPIQDLGSVMTTRYRAVSPVFPFTLPPDSALLILFPDVCSDAVAGTYSPAVADGVFLMLAPLPAGPHGIHFHAEFPSFGFTLDVTYNLNVTG